MPFPSTVNANPAPGLEGGWASANDHFSMLTPGNGDPAVATYAAWKVGAGTATLPGVIVGRFAFANTANGQVTSAHPGVATVRCGFVHRYHPVVITTFLGENAMTLYAGQEVDIVDAGDFWCKFAAGATAGQKVFALYADGSAVAGTAGSPPTATGVTWNQNNSVNVTNVAGGTLYAGQPVSGTGIPAGAYVVSVSGSTAVLSAATTGGSTTGNAVTQTTAYETRWTVDSPAAAGDLAKISTRG